MTESDFTHWQLSVTVCCLAACLLSIQICLLSADLSFVSHRTQQRKGNRNKQRVTARRPQGRLPGQIAKRWMRIHKSVCVSVSEKECVYVCLYRVEPASIKQKRQMIFNLTLIKTSCSVVHCHGKLGRFLSNKAAIYGVEGVCEWKVCDQRKEILLGREVSRCFLIYVGRYLCGSVNTLLAECFLSCMCLLIVVLYCECVCEVND